MLGVLGLGPCRRHRLSRRTRELRPLGFLGLEGAQAWIEGKVIARGYARRELAESAEARVQAAQFYRYSGRDRVRERDA